MKSQDRCIYSWWLACVLLSASFSRWTFWAVCSVNIFIGPSAGSQEDEASEAVFPLWRGLSLLSSNSQYWGLCASLTLFCLQSSIQPHSIYPPSLGTCQVLKPRSQHPEQWCGWYMVWWDEREWQAAMPPCKVLVGVAELKEFRNPGLVLYLKATEKRQNIAWEVLVSFSGT